MKLVIDIANQTLTLYKDRCALHEYRVSTALKGVGEEQGSEQTPRGEHIIHEKFGAGMPLNTVFSGRRPTGEIYTPELAAQHPGRDWILTRILWLSGQEMGKNSGGNVDTLKRYIYIHGTPDENAMGEPGSHGCIRMHNHDLVQLFDLVEIGDVVSIHAPEF